MLFVQQNATEIQIILHSIKDGEISQTGILKFTTSSQRAGIKSFTPFGNDKLFIVTTDGQLLIYFLNKYTKSFKLLAKNKIHCKMISVAEICPLGEYVMVCTQNQFAKLDKIFCWRMNSSYQLVLPLMLDLGKSKLAKE